MRKPENVGPQGNENFEFGKVVEGLIDWLRGRLFVKTFAKTVGVPVFADIWVVGDV
jgi:hypothetical protein